MDNKINYYSQNIIKSELIDEPNVYESKIKFSSSAYFRMVRLFVLGFLYLNITASFIVSGTVGILIGYGHFLIYVLKNKAAGIVCVHRGCFQSSKLLLIVAAHINFGYILMIYFTFVLWARYKEFEIEI